LDQADDALSCLFSAALRALPWTKRYGLRLKLHIGSDGGRGGGVGGDGVQGMRMQRARPGDDEGEDRPLVNMTSWELIPIVPLQDTDEQRNEVRGEFTTHTSSQASLRIQSVVVILNLQADSVPYASMAKNSLMQQPSLLAPSRAGK
jgi:hypothetical protein